MTETVNEFRVRPVTRYNLTHFCRDEKGGSSRTIGEFNEDVAMETGRALRDQIPGAVLFDHRDEIVGPMATALYPSRYPLGSQVVRKETDLRSTEIGLRGALLRHEAEPAVIVGIHFYPFKVCYDVTFPSGREAETVESTELSAAT